MNRWASLLEALRRYDLLCRVPAAGPAGELTGIVTDSRQVKAGSVFVAMRGSSEDGHRYVPAAVAAGAAAVIVERELATSVSQVIVTDGRRAAIALARAWYGDPAAELELFGVTGTNGKTTTVAILAHLLNREGDAGTIGTLGACDGAGRKLSSGAASLTTPAPVDLHAAFGALRQRGVKRVAMETSSHSLDQGRLDGLAFRGAVFTNLTQDHLDYHGTMGHYHAAKLRLLELLEKDAVLARNADDPAWHAIPRTAGTVTFGLAPDADLRASDAALDARGCRFRITGRFGTQEALVPLPGRFNIVNALGAAACVLGLGRPLGELVERLAQAPQVPGRMERITADPFLVVRDYAHTPDALERALETLRPLTAGRLIVVFGCGGDRDRLKRPIMGRIVAERADLAVVTSDNPRTEDPERIIEDILAGIPPGAEFLRITDRRRAIRETLTLAKPGDTVLLAGKGHETYQVIGTEYLPFDERDIVRELLDGRGER